MTKLKAEIDAVKQHNYRLSFKVPTATELAQLRKISRDIPKKDLEKIRKAKKGVEDLVALIESGTLERESVPPDLWDAISKLTKPKGDVRK